VFRRARRLAVAACVLVASGGAALIPVSTASATGSYRVTLDQLASTLQVGEPDLVVAEVRDTAGNPAPDGTVVTFTTSGGSDDSILSFDAVGMAPHGNDGYWLVNSAGIVVPFGSAITEGDLTADAAEEPSGAIVGMAPTPSSHGYWLAADDGKIYGFGDTAVGVFDTGLGRGDPVVGITAGDGDGGWVVTEAGQVRAFGSSPDLGSAHGPTDVAGVVASPTGHGYWVFSHSGLVMAFGDAAFKGDLHSVRLNKPIMGFLPFASGYMLVGSDGGIFNFSDRPFMGSLGSRPSPVPVRGIVATPGTQGYWMFNVAGTVYTFGDATNQGDGSHLPTLGGVAVFLFTSLVPGSTTVTADVAGATSAVTQRWTAPVGYWMVSSDGAVYAFGGATELGDVTDVLKGRAAVDLEPTPTTLGYWIVYDAGHVFPFGDAGPLGEIGAGVLVTGERVTSLTATPSGRGYWIFTSKGRVVPFGDATFLGDMSKVTLNGPVLGSIATPSGRGYYMVASDGGIFAFGDARFAGSMGGKRLNAPVQSLVPDPDGAGYWLVASDGGIFAFDAAFHGSMGGTKLNKPISGMVPYGDGYLMVGADGGIFNFSNLPFSGSLGDKPPAAPVVAVAAVNHA
jgi:hypothetical protein